MYLICVYKEVFGFWLSFIIVMCKDSNEILTISK